MKIATLGPEGTFSHEAVLQYDGKAHILFKPTIWDVFEAIEHSEVDMGVVPIENSISGTIGFTIDALYHFNQQITDELLVKVNHNLVSNGKETKTLYLHPETHHQCEKFIRENFGEVKIIPTSSNAESAKLASETKYGAAITSQLSASLYGLKILSKDVQDNKDNVTKFFIIGGNSHKSTNNDRTTISINPQADRPGLLYKLLGIFYKQNINLSKIESVPVKGKLGQYFFLIDFEGHKDDEKVKKALDKVRQLFFLKIHGSYPRKY